MLSYNDNFKQRAKSCANPDQRVLLEDLSLEPGDPVDEAGLRSFVPAAKLPAGCHDAKPEENEHRRNQSNQ